MTTFWISLRMSPGPVKLILILMRPKLLTQWMIFKKVVLLACRSARKRNRISRSLTGKGIRIIVDVRKGNRIFLVSGNK